MHGLKSWLGFAGSMTGTLGSQLAEVERQPWAREPADLQVESCSHGPVNPMISR